MDVQRWDIAPWPMGEQTKVRPVRYVADDRPADHPSETALDGAEFDYAIWAYGVEDLKRDAVEVFQSILGTS